MFLGLASALPLQQAAAQDVLGGAIVGGALGGIIGGALGRGGGAIAGAAIGATTGAVIAAEAQRRSSGDYRWRGGCYYRYPNGRMAASAAGLLRVLIRRFCDLDWRSQR